MYMHQLQYFTKQNDNVNPRQSMIANLKDEIQKFTDLGDSILLLGNFDEDVGAFLTEWKEALELKDMMIDSVGVWEISKNIRQRVSTD